MNPITRVKIDWWNSVTIGYMQVQQLVLSCKYLFIV